jgi:hypothetical protein
MDGCCTPRYHLFDTYRSGEPNHTSLKSEHSDWVYIFRPIVTRSPHKLEYSPRPHFSGRRPFIWLVVLLGLASFGISVYLWAPGAIAKYQIWQQTQLRKTDWEKCLNYSSAPNCVVFEDDPKMLSSFKGGSYVRIAGNAGMNYAQEVDSAPGFVARKCGFPGGECVFLHSRESRSHHLRLVDVEVETESQYGGSAGQRFLWFDAFVADPNPDGTWRYMHPPEMSSLDPVMLTIQRPLSRDYWWDLRDGPEPHLTIWAGQPDPIDTSRFTIRYRYRGSLGTITGTVDDADQLEFDVNGPLQSTQ